MKQMPYSYQLYKCIKNKLLFFVIKIEYLILNNDSYLHGLFRSMYKSTHRYLRPVEMENEEKYEFCINSFWLQE